MSESNSRTIRTVLFFLLVSIVIAPPVSTEPRPGDLFREYGYLKYLPKSQGLWRIGYKWNSINGKVIDVGDIDLGKATRAEACIEKVLCHDRTRGLAIKFNGNTWHPFPEAAQINSPQWEYQHHTFPEVEVPLTELKASGNTMEITVEKTSASAQNLTYGVLVRVYYSPDKSPLRGGIVSPVSGAIVGDAPKVTAEIEKAETGVDRVEFIGLYEDYNYKGDGEYRQWQYRWYMNEMHNHMGTARSSPYTITWNNEWVPEQPKPMKFAARIVDKNGMIFMTPAVENLNLRRGYTVELCKPDRKTYPKSWVTRKGVKGEEFTVTGDLSKATGALARVVVWQHESKALEYTFGTGVKVTAGKAKKPNIVADAEIPVTALKKGKNSLKTQKTRSGHHGIEVQWPGIVILVRYSTPSALLPGRVEPVNRLRPEMRTRTVFPVCAAGDCMFLINGARYAPTPAAVPANGIFISEPSFSILRSPGVLPTQK